MSNFANTTLTLSQVNKGAQAIINKTSALTQVLRTFADLYDKELPDTEGLTTEAWLSAMGVERFIAKNGKKKGYTPGTIRAGWSPEMLTDGGEMCTFKNVRAKYNDGKKAVAVYTRAEAEKLDGKPLSRYMRTVVGEDKWTVAIILRGLKQSRDFKTHEEKELLSEMAYEEMTDLCIIRITEENGKQIRQIISVPKSEVYF